MEFVSGSVVLRYKANSKFSSLIPLNHLDIVPYGLWAMSRGGKRLIWKLEYFFSEKRTINVMAINGVDP